MIIKRCGCSKVVHGFIYLLRYDTNKTYVVVVRQTLLLSNASSVQQHQPDGGAVDHGLSTGRELLARGFAFRASVNGATMRYNIYILHIPI
jgi:hypothetical protein